MKLFERLGMYATTVTLACGGAALSGSIPVVISHGSEKQVIGINAGRIVTAMKHAQSSWDRAVMKFPRHTMRGYQFILERKESVPEVPCGSRPQPALVLVSFFHFSPKSRRDISGLTVIATSRGTVTRRERAIWSAPVFKLGFTLTTDESMFWVSHDLNLTNRLGLWSGSLGVSAPRGPFCFQGEL